MFALLDWKLGGSVGRSYFFFFFFLNLDTEVQYHSYVCGIIEHAEPKNQNENWFNPGVGGGCIPFKEV